MQSAAATHSHFSPDPVGPFDTLPGRTLDRSELADLAEAVASQRHIWQRHVLHDSEHRHSVQLYRDLSVDVWLLCWSNQQETGFHDHDVSSGAVRVVDGNLVEDRLEAGAQGLKEVSTARPAGSAFDFGSTLIHRVRHPEGETPAISIHAYSPPLWRMGHYATDDSGALGRTSVSYAEELSPAPVTRLKPRGPATAEQRETSRKALEQIVGALGYPVEWAAELERREFEAGRVWRAAEGN
jgi:hypothetical protein